MKLKHKMEIKVVILSAAQNSQICKFCENSDSQLACKLGLWTFIIKVHGLLRLEEYLIFALETFSYLAISREVNFMDILFIKMQIIHIKLLTI